MTTEAAETPVAPALRAKQCERNSRRKAIEAASATVGKESAHEEPIDLMSAVLDRPNMLKAYARVRRNKGAPGVDGMTVEQLGDYLKSHWPGHHKELLEGRYIPQPVKQVEIPKPGGGKRLLWVQWKRPFTRAKNLMHLGLNEERAWTCACNQRGPWWNAGASHLNQALPTKLFNRFGLVSLMDYYHQLKRLT